MKWTLLACLDSENHPSLHKGVPQVSFPVKRTVIWPGIQGIRIDHFRYTKIQLGSEA